ncbi:MAG: DsbA family protein [Candidatus Tectomicrobia bacterium]|uniref:DsbA family protein n=1 Tax=Tectimicrobiota bacterium TaxID=2528274 RepID=A0A932CLN9_UNCTE|nr:DsbA family protein [Candidatus Tectomicrobia bacterium]
MAIVLKVYFDYASPLCYIGYRVMDRLEQEFPVKWCWKGLEIYPGGNQTWSDPRIQEQMKAKVQRVASEAGVEIKIPQRWTTSRLALEGAEYAKGEGKFPAYHRAIFEACFQQGRDIGKALILCEIAEEVGLDSEGLLNCLHSRRMANIIDRNRQDAWQEEATGFPALMLGSFPLIGAHPYETIKHHLERYLLVLSRQQGEKKQ